MTARRWLLAAVVVLALVAGFVLTRGDRPAAPAPGAGSPASELSPAPSSGGGATPPPRLPSDSPAEAVATTPSGLPREHTLPDGTRVRDHRADPAEPFSIPTTPPQRRTVPMKSDEVARVHAQLRPLTDGCTASVPDAERAADASVQVRLLVSVKDGTMTVDEASATARGLGTSGAAVETCIRERASSIQIATEHEAMQRYPLTFPYRVRR